MPVRVRPAAPRRSSLRTARKRQARKRLPFPHLCSVAPPSQIGPAAPGSDLDNGSDLDRPGGTTTSEGLGSIPFPRFAQEPRKLHIRRVFLPFPKRSSHGGAPFRLWREAGIWIAPVHHVGVHSARLGKGRRESACLFLICAPWLLLPKSDPLRRAPIWITVRICVRPAERDASFGRDVRLRQVMRAPRASGTRHVALRPSRKTSRFPQENTSLRPRPDTSHPARAGYITENRQRPGAPAGAPGLCLLSQFCALCASP